ncbi:hypothetical protein HX052_15170 [Myroides marinus]|uniref:hypothetical protein n=1 Tax=Myroides marinus TaxID=703342 RepID=UPI002574A9F5|nr:hypothetical protein [Myroides marinus]MDM1391293.1 hypothetical protein [Myroides marinus]
MKRFYLVILVFIVMFTIPKGYGQTINGTNQFASSASVVYLNGNPKAYLEDAKVRFFTNFKVKHVPAVPRRYEEPGDVKELMRSKYRYLDTNVVLADRLAIDVSNHRTKEVFDRAWRNDFTFLENLFVDLLFGLLSR